MTIKALVKKAHKNAVDKGFYGKQTVAGNLMLIVTELGEACEAHRNGRMCKDDIQTFYKTWKNPEQNQGISIQKLFRGQIKDTFEDEIADCFIRLGDLCGYMKIDIEKHIEAKMAYNETREQKHGKEY